MDMHPSIRSLEPLRSQGNDLPGAALPLRDCVRHSSRGVGSGTIRTRSLGSGQFGDLSSVIDIRLEGVLFGQSLVPRAELSWFSGVESGNTVPSCGVREPMNVVFLP